MRNPQRSRNIGLAFFASGIVVMIVHFLLPKEAAQNDLLKVILVLYWPNAILFGAGSAFFSHLKVRAQNSLLRGEGVLARWRVDAATWSAFIEANGRLNQQPGTVVSELAIRKDVPADGIEVIVGKDSVQIDGSIHSLPLRGTPEITHAALENGRPWPAYVELGLYYPAGGENGTEVRTALRFPVAASAERDAESVVRHYNRDQPGEPDFFHGSGDGTNPEDLSKCMSCGYETHKFLSSCPQCGKGMLSKRWSRRFGWVLFLCGLFLAGLMGTIIYFTAPTMLRPGIDINGTRFSGTAEQGKFFLGIFGVVAAFGVTSMLYGLYQIKTGRRDKRVIYLLVGIFLLWWLVSMWF